MRLLDRYLFRELLAPLAYCLGGFLIFWISFDAFPRITEFEDDKLHLMDIIEYYLAMTPEFIVTVLPIALLLALLYALTQHARHNEITAIRAAGMSLWRLSAPYLLVGLVASVALFALNEFLVPPNADWADHILNRYVARAGNEAQNHFTDFVNAREHRLWHFSRYQIKKAEMLNPMVSWTLPDGSIKQLKAERAVFTNGAWTFFGVREFAQANANAPMFPSFQTNIITLPEFRETPKEILSEVKISEYQAFREERHADIPLADLVVYLRMHPDLSRADADWLFTKLYGRLAAPWTCLIVVMMAIPFGAASGRRNLFFGVAGSIFICFAYFVLQQFGMALGLGGRLPPWLAAWLPNIIFGTTGLVLTVRVR